MKWDTFITLMIMIWLWSYLMCSSQEVKADYMLQTLTLSDKNTIQAERFISYVDCRKRGLRNLDLLSAVGVKGGFVCIDMMEVSDD